MKDRRVSFRDFDDKDIDFIFKTKNQKSIYENTVSEYHEFSYEDAVQWMNGCKNTEYDYRFWVICTADAENRIVGWCGISKINPVNKSVFFHGITINDPEYNDGLSFCEAHLFIMHYVFEELKYNRLYGAYLTEYALPHKIDEMFGVKEEGVMKQAVYKDGTYHDVTISAIISKDYFEKKDRGALSIEEIQKEFIENNFDFEHDCKVDIESFLSLVRQTLDDVDPQQLNAATEFRKLPQWSSLSALLVVSMVNEEYKIALTGEELASAKTLQDVYDILLSKL